MNTEQRDTLKFFSKNSLYSWEEIGRYTFELARCISVESDVTHLGNHISFDSWSTEIRTQISDFSPRAVIRYTARTTMHSAPVIPKLSPIQVLNRLAVF